MDTLFAILTNPLVYAGLLGGLGAYYAVWAATRKQYLSVNKLFNLFTLMMVSGLVAAMVLQMVQLQSWQDGWQWHDAVVHLRPWTSVIAYVVLYLAGLRYLREIRFPYWRSLDIASLGLTVWWMCMCVGWAVYVWHWARLVAVMGALIGGVGIIWLYRKVDKPGLISALHISWFFGILTLMHYMIPAWQESLSVVEWIVDGSGIAVGVLIVVFRLSAKSEKMLLQDIPRGVSQGFRDTFSRAFKPADSSKDNGV